MDYYTKYNKYKNKYYNLKNGTNCNNFVYQDYNTKEKRKQKFDELLNSKRIFNNKIFLIGFGCVGRPLLWLIIKNFTMNYNNIFIIEERNINSEAVQFINIGVNIINTNFNEKNYQTILQSLSFNDIIIDAGTSISTLDLMKLCQEKGANFICSCIQEWDIEQQRVNNEFYKDSIIYRHKILDEYNNSILNKNFNCIVSMGCNPGNVSLWAKIGLNKIAEDKKLFNHNLNYNKLAQKLGIQTIHISEKDTQISNIPKKINEYCNTWSMKPNNYYGEGLSCLELSWGTHEPAPIKVFKDSKFNLNENNNLVVSKLGFYTYAQSWVPYYEKYIGHLVCHDESNTIGETLTIYENNKIIYKPSVYYVYHSCNDAMASIHELKERNEADQDNYRLLTSEIIDGRDILGITYFLEDKNIYWIGSLLSIHESRDLFDNNINNFINATNTQVIAGYFSGILYFLDLGDKKVGMMDPDDLPVDKIIKYQLPMLGEFIFIKKNDYKIKVLDNNVNSYIYELDEWTFNNFLIG